MSINYKNLIDEAMRSIIKRILGIVRDIGCLPSNNHFYISFNTQYPGATLSDRMKRLYPEEITIVIQNQFEDLLVSDTNFSAILSFNGLKERVVVPFNAITSFIDPNVYFGLRFQSAECDTDSGLDAINNFINTDNALNIPVKINKKKPASSKAGKSNAVTKKIININDLRNKKK